MELFFQLLTEFFLPIIGELLAEIFADQVFRRTASERAWIRFFLYSFIGAAIGGLSLIVFPEHLVGHVGLRVTALAVNPVVIGLVMARLGRWRTQGAGAPFGLEAFWPAWGFAFCLGLVRTLFAG